jgi:DNA-binding PadR family transcriptional regulator
MFSFGRGRHGDGHHHDHDHDRRMARGDFWPPRDHGHGFGRGGRLGRMFAHGDLQYVILFLIAQKPSHGYEIIKAIEEKVGGAYSPSPGTIYPALTMLEEQGYIAVVPAEGAKKRFAITPEGQAYMEQNRAAVAALLSRMEAVGASHGGDQAPQILRAVENLKLALRLRLGRGPLTEEQILAIAAALDRATGEIERS